MENQQACSAAKSFKYCIWRGNHSDYVAAALARRPWWEALPHEGCKSWEEHNKQFHFTWKPVCLIGHDPKSGKKMMISDVRAAHLLQEDRKTAVALTDQLINHLPFKTGLVRKDGLLRSMHAYYGLHGKNTFNVTPLTYLVRPEADDVENRKFKTHFHAITAHFKQSPEEQA